MNQNEKGESTQNKKRTPDGQVAEERYAPPKRSITPEDSTFAGEAVVAGDGAANASTAVKNRGTCQSPSAQ